MIESIPNSMTTDLEERLKNCPKEERRDFITQIVGERNSGKVVDELIRMVERGDRLPARYGKRPWYWVCGPLLEPERDEFDLNDQILAIWALGYSGEKKALDFLEELHTPKTEYILYEQIPIIDEMSGYSGSDYEYIYDWYVTYPNAKGALGRGLEHFEKDGFSELGNRLYTAIIESIWRLESIHKKPAPVKIKPRTTKERVFRGLYSAAKAVLILSILVPIYMVESQK
jgi:hypothetical protein